MKKLFLVLVGLVALYFIIMAVTPAKPTDSEQGKVRADAYKYSTYEIEGRQITLDAGRAEEEVAPGSAEKLVTQYFGNEVTGDFNGDNQGDVAFLLTQNAGGTGTFYYVVAAFGSDRGFAGSNAILLGDRIAPQTTEFRDGKIIVNFADRNAADPMTTAPSIGVSKYFVVQNEKLVSVP